MPKETYVYTFGTENLPTITGKPMTRLGQFIDQGSFGVFEPTRLKSRRKAVDTAVAMVPTQETVNLDKLYGLAEKAFKLNPYIIIAHTLAAQLNEHTPPIDKKFTNGTVSRTIADNKRGLQVTVKKLMK